MLDADADHVRIDRLREHLEERKQAAEKTGEIRAYGTVLQYLETGSETTSRRPLDEIRE